MADTKCSGCGATVDSDSHDFSHAGDEGDKNPFAGIKNKKGTESSSVADDAASAVKSGKMY